MTVNLYEGMFLLESGKYNADPDGAAKEITAMIEKSAGTIVAHRPWQDGRLAYPIKGQRRGLHYLCYFEMPTSGLKELNRSCRLNENLLRHLIIVQPRVLFDAMVAALSGHVSTTVPDEPPPQRDRDDRGRGRGRPRRPADDDLEVPEDLNSVDD